MNVAIRWHTIRIDEQGYEYMATRTQMTDTGIIRAHGRGHSPREAREDATLKHFNELTRRRNRLSRKFPNIDY